MRYASKYHFLRQRLSSPTHRVNIKIRAFRVVKINLLAFQLELDFNYINYEYCQSLSAMDNRKRLRLTGFFLIVSTLASCYGENILMVRFDRYVWIANQITLESL